MKALVKKLYDFTEKIKSYVLSVIDRLSEKDIKKAQRDYELIYGKELNRTEITEIKKNVVIRIWKYVVAFLIIVLFLAFIFFRG